MNADRSDLQHDLPGPPAAAWAIVPDLFCATAGYILAYRLRFDAEMFANFFASGLRLLPVVAGCQMSALIAVGIYRKGGRYRLTSRLIFAIAAGTGIAMAITWRFFGFEGISRMAFLVAGAFFAAAAMTWRGAFLLWRYSKTSHSRLADHSPLVDRTSETVSLSATFLSIVHYRQLLRNLVLKDLKLKYRGSVFGFLWSLANPLVMILVYTVAFTVILPVRSEGFAFFVLLGVLAWTFFASSATMSSGAIVDNAGLIKSLYFPRAILPTSVVLFNLAQYVLTVIVFFPLMFIIYRTPLSANMLLFPIFLALQVGFLIGLALMLSTATAFFRDVRHLVDVSLLALFWTTPVVYELRLVPERLRLPIMLSPMSPFIVAYQQLFYYRQSPEPTVWFLAISYALVALIAGTATFVAVQDRLTERV